MGEVSVDGASVVHLGHLLPLHTGVSLTAATIRPRWTAPNDAAAPSAPGCPRGRGPTHRDRIVVQFSQFIVVQPIPSSFNFVRTARLVQAVARDIAEHHSSSMCDVALLCSGLHMRLLRRHDLCLP